MKKIILLMFVFTLVSANSYASTATSTITAIEPMDNGLVFFTSINSHNGGVPSCATSQPQRYVFSTNTAGGKNMLAVLLTAYASARTLWIVGTGECSVWSDTETTYTFSIVD